jgi:hypothetical protein
MDIVEEFPVSGSDRAIRIVKFFATPQRWINFLFRHPSLTFVLMGAFFLLFGVTSVNLFVLLKMNIDLFVEYGLMVIEDGALQQLAELLGSAYLSMLFWLLFRLCERIIIERMIRARLRGAVKAELRAGDALTLTEPQATIDPRR